MDKPVLRYEIGGRISKQYPDGRFVYSLVIPIKWTLPERSILLSQIGAIEATEDPAKILDVMGAAIQAGGDQRSIKNFSRIRDRIDAAKKNDDALELENAFASLLYAILSGTQETAKKSGKRKREEAEQIINACEDVRIAELFRRAAKPNIDWPPITFIDLLRKAKTKERYSYNRVKAWADIRPYSVWLKTQRRKK